MCLYFASYLNLYWLGIDEDNTFQIRLCMSLEQNLYVLIGFKLLLLSKNPPKLQYIINSKNKN